MLFDPCWSEITLLSRKSFPIIPAGSKVVYADTTPQIGEPISLVALKCQIKHLKFSAVRDSSNKRAKNVPKRDAINPPAVRFLIWPKNNFFTCGLRKGPPTRTNAIHNLRQTFPSIVRLRNKPGSCGVRSISLFLALLHVDHLSPFVVKSVKEKTFIWRFHSPTSSESGQREEKKENSIREKLIKSLEQTEFSSSAENQKKMISHWLYLFSKQ